MRLKDFFLVQHTLLIVFLGLSPENYELHVFGLSGMPLLYLSLFFLWALKINELMNLLELGKLIDILRKIGNVLLSPLTFAFLKLSFTPAEFYSLRNGLVEIRKIYTPQEIKSELFEKYGFGEYVRNYPVTDKLVEVRYSRENFFCIFDEEYNKHIECLKALKEKLILERIDVDFNKKGFEFTKLVSDFYTSHPYIVWGVGISAVLVSFSVFVYLISGSTGGDDPGGATLNQGYAFLLEKVTDNSNKIASLSETSDKIASLSETVTGLTDGELLILKEFLNVLTPTGGHLLFKLLDEVERIDKAGRWPSYLYKATENLMFDGVRKHWDWDWNAPD